MIEKVIKILETAKRNPCDNQIYIVAALEILKNGEDEK